MDFLNCNIPKCNRTAILTKIMYLWDFENNDEILFFKGGTMLFYAFRVVHTVKELDSHAKHAMDKVSKTLFGRIIVFQCQKSHFRVRTSFGEFFSTVALADVNGGGTPYMGISPGRMHPCMHRPEQVRTQQRASFGCTAQDSLGKNVPNSVVKRPSTSVPSRY